MRRGVRPADLAAAGLGLLLLGLLLLPACGGELPAVPPHGLVLPRLEPATTLGETVSLDGPPPLGSFTLALDTRWTRRQDGGAEEAGAARIRLEVTNAREPDGGISTHLALALEDPTGVAADLVGSLDGLGLTFLRRDDGRPDRSTLRFAGRAPPGAVLFFEDQCFAGWGLGARWWPRRPMPVGGTWGPEDLDLREAAVGTWGGEGLAVDRQGAGKLLAATDASATVALATLSTVAGTTTGPGRPRRLSLGVRGEGRAEVDRATGRAREWTYEGEVRYFDHDGRKAGSLELHQWVRGRVLGR